MGNNALTPEQIQIFNESMPNSSFTSQQMQEIDSRLKAAGLYEKTGLSDAQMAQVKSIIDQAAQATSKLNEVNFIWPTKADPKDVKTKKNTDWYSLALKSHDAMNILQAGVGGSNLDPSALLPNPNDPIDMQNPIPSKLQLASFGIGALTNPMVQEILRQTGDWIQYTAWPTFTNALSSMWQGLKDAGAGLLNWFTGTDLWDSLCNFSFSDWWEEFSAEFENFMENTVPEDAPYFLPFFLSKGATDPKSSPLPAGGNGSSLANLGWAGDYARRSTGPQRINANFHVNMSGMRNDISGENGYIGFTGNVSNGLINTWGKTTTGVHVWA